MYTHFWLPNPRTVSQICEMEVDCDDTSQLEVDRMKAKLGRDIINETVTHEELMEVYSKWADSYDQDMVLFDYKPPVLLAEKTAVVLGGQTSAKILDCGAGTGLVGVELHKLGYTNLDALDASQEMLQQAKQKHVYNRLICDFMGTNRMDINENTYDALVCTGTLTPNHVNGDCLEELIRITKTGGYILLLIKESYLHDPGVFKGTLEEQMQGLHDRGRWQWTKREVVPEYLSDSNGVLFAFEVV